MFTTTYAVEGMICSHCVAAVSAELGRLPDVTGVRADLATGTVTVASAHALDLETVRGAVEEAGFLLAARPSDTRDAAARPGNASDDAARPDAASGDGPPADRGDAPP